MEKKVKYEDKILLNSVIGRCILEVNFFLVFKKLVLFFFWWKGDEFGNKVFFVFKDVFLEDKKYFLCCMELLVGVFIFWNVKLLFVLDKKYVMLVYVIV